MKGIVTVTMVILAISLQSCYEGSYTYPVKITGNQETYKISYRDNQGVWHNEATVPNGFTIYNEYNTDWQLDLIAIGDSVHVGVFLRSTLIAEYWGRDTLEIHTQVPHRVEKVLHW